MEEIVTWLSSSVLPDTGEEEMKWEKSKKKKRKGSKVAKETKTELKQSVYSA